MTRFIVERNLPGAGNLSPEERQALARTYLQAIYDLEKYVHWVVSFVTEDKLYCILVAESADIVRNHARLCKLPIHQISEVKNAFDPMSINSLDKQSATVISCACL